MATAIVLPASTLKPADIRFEFDLPSSGKHVIVLRGKGRDQRRALMSAGPGADQYRILQALIAQLVLIDGQRIKMEDIDEMDFDDSMALTEEVGKILSPLKVTKASTLATDATEASDCQLLS
jgi:hypothetical protein